MLDVLDVDVFIDGRPVLSGVRARIERGGFVGVLGPNGAGKTTLLRVMAGIARPSRGEVVFEGRPMACWPDRERARQMAFVSQNPGIGFGFTVWDVVAMGRYPHRRPLARFAEEDRRAVEEAMAATGVAALRDRPVSGLSGGERQRVFLARALAQKPRVLFLDEPIAHLDVRYQLEILRLIADLRARFGWTVVIALHDLNWALRFCETVLVMKDGRLAASGPVEHVLVEPLIEYVFGVENRIVREGGRPPRVEVLDPVPVRPSIGGEKAS
ncbi:MAG: ABC transporter ATP-binding protein [Firmicutes bacterium]|nr:ABC transporter ATP-binding protein [Bacillota bacterium]